MSYRQSTYQPLAHEVAGPSLRPFNWVQKLGAILVAVGVAYLLLWAAGRAGWTPRWVGEIAPVYALIMLGAVFIQYRREDSADAPQRARNRALLVAAAVTLTTLAALVMLLDQFL